MNELISIIMPAYNADVFIQDAIQSVRRQSYTKWELLIVNDGSIDNTEAIIENFCNEDTRIKYFYQENGKQGKARNLGIKHARGNYLAFLDADDIWMPEKLEVQLAEININKVDLVFSDSYVFSDAAAINSSRKINSFKGECKGEKGLNLLLEINGIPNLTVLVETSKVQAVGCFSEIDEIQNAEDYHLWLKLLIAGFSFYGSEKTLAAYRVHKNSSTFYDNLASKQFFEVLSDISCQFPNSVPLIIKSLSKKYMAEKTENVRLQSIVTAYRESATFKLVRQVQRIKTFFNIVKK
jgi:glycosyltransferase involved in cell wall biosynthesis